MKHPDIATLFLAIEVTTLLLGVAMALFARGSALLPLRLWGGGLLLYCSAYVLLMLRGRIADVLSIVVANVLHSAAIALTGYAIARLARSGKTISLYWGPPLAMAVLLILLMDDFRWRSFVVNVVFSGQIGLMIVLLGGYRSGRWGGRVLLMGTLSAMVAILSLRAGAFAFDLVPPKDLLEPGPLQTVTYVFALGSLLLCTLGFMFMVKEQADRALADSERQRHLDLSQRLEEVTALNRKLEAAQNQLLQSEKMVSLGQLAAGVAHEINNPVGFVNSNLGTLARYVDELLKLATVGAASPAGRALAAQVDLNYLRSDVRALLTESADGLERVRRIVQDLSDFSHPNDAEWQQADLHRCLEATLNVIWNEFKDKCVVIRQYGQLPEIHCQPFLLNQVFMNLLLNAAQAIDERGEIVIRTERVGTAEVRVTIADTGRGIAPDHLKRLFEPFFTTKPVGQGTGLGLSLSWGIVQRHQGRIEVASELGKGTTFTVTLPIGPASGMLEDSP